MKRLLATLALSALSLLGIGAAARAHEGPNDAAGGLREDEMARENNTINCGSNGSCLTSVLGVRG